MQAVSVSALVSFLREVIEGNEIFSDLWVSGEVSNYSRPSSGHRYFSLKDAGATLRSVWFASTMPGANLQNGDRVLAHGRVSIYVQRGELQFVCDFVRPEGVGLAAAKFEELRLRLEAEGLFDPSRKRPLPRFPMRIGVVTSPTGAALQDIKNVIAKRWPLAELVLSPAIVQGEAAAGHIEVALKRLAQESDLDLVIIARGGGSSEDLSAFNEERVVRTVFGFPVPVVSGVGHETDVTITDLVADLRAPTPSAAAERATPDVVQVHRELSSIDRAMAGAALGNAARGAARVESIIRALDRCAPQPSALARDVQSGMKAMADMIERRRTAEESRLLHQAARLTVLDPRATLGRGFAIVEKATPTKKSVVSSVKRVRGGDRLMVSVADGAFTAEVS